MPKSIKNQEPQPRDSESTSSKRPYSKPELENLGRIRDLTLMPGGSMNSEGGSGKPHKQ